MPQRVVFTMARQIESKDCVALRQRFHVPPPAERSAQQSMQQQKRTPCPKARVVNLVSIDLCRKFLDLHGSLRTTAFPFRALKYDVIASVASECGALAGKPRNFL